MVQVTDHGNNVVAFTDIVGFTDIAKDERDYTVLAEAIKGVFDKLEGETILFNSAIGSGEDIRIALIGDAFLVCIPADSMDSTILRCMDVAFRIQRLLFRDHRLLTSGGVDSGNVFTVGSFPSGNGISRAHDRSKEGRVQNLPYAIVVPIGLMDRVRTAYIEQSINRKVAEKTFESKFGSIQIGENCFRLPFGTVPDETDRKSLIDSVIRYQNTESFIKDPARFLDGLKKTIDQFNTVYPEDPIDYTKGERGIFILQ